LISGKFRSSSCRDQNQSGNWGAQRQREPSRAQPSPTPPHGPPQPLSGWTVAIKLYPTWYPPHSFIHSFLPPSLPPSCQCSLFQPHFPVQPLTRTLLSSSLLGLSAPIPAPIAPRTESRLAACYSA
jgi:hypothetical protein